MPPVTFLVPEADKELIAFLKHYYPMSRVGETPELKAELEKRDIKRHSLLLKVNDLLAQGALFNTISYKLRHELDAFLYNKTCAKLIGMPTIHELIQPTSYLAPYLIAPPAYLYAWYMMKGYAVLRARTIAQFRGCEEFHDAWDELNDHYDIASMLHRSQGHFGGVGWKNYHGPKSSYFDDVVSGNLHSDVMCTEAIMSYMVDSFGQSTPPPSKRAIRESIKFDVHFWEELFKFKNVISDCVSARASVTYKTPTVVAYGLFLSFVLYSSIIAKGQEYTCFTKHRIEKPLLSSTHVIQLNTLIPNLISELGVSVTKDFEVTTNISAMTLPPLAQPCITKKMQNIIALFNPNLKQRHYESTDFSPPYMHDSFTCTNSRGTSWSELVHLGLHNMGIYEGVRQGDESKLRVLMSILSDKMVLILSGLNTEDRVIALRTLTRLVNESSLPITYMNIIARVEEILQGETAEEA